MRASSYFPAMFMVAVWAALVPVPLHQIVQPRREIVIPPEGTGYQLSGVAALAVGPAGAIALADRAANEVLVFDARGRLVKRFGGRGEGPGQFRVIVDIGFLGDSIWVADPIAQRVTLFRPDGLLLRTLAPTLVQAGGRPIARPLALLANGAVLAAGSFPARPSDAMAAVPYVGIGPSRKADTLVLWPTPGRWALPSTGNSALDAADPVVFQPFSPTHMFRFSRHDETVFLVDGVEKIGPRLQRIAVTRRHLTGTQVFRTSLAVSAVAVSQHMIDSALAAVRQIRPMSPTALRGSLVVPDFVDPVTAVVPASDGGVYLRLRPAADQVMWIRLGAKGDSIASVQLPKLFQGLAAAGQSLYGAETDPDGLPLVVRYDVRRR